MQLINLTFEGMLKPKQKREYTPIEIKLPNKVNPNSDVLNILNAIKITF